MMKTEQMEISFANGSRNYRIYRGQQRRSRAKWWFSQMRMVVEAVTGGRPAGIPRPEQTYFRL